MHESTHPDFRRFVSQFPNYPPLLCFGLSISRFRSGVRQVAVLANLSNPSYHVLRLPFAFSKTLNEHTHVGPVKSKCALKWPENRGSFPAKPLLIGQKPMFILAKFVHFRPHIKPINSLKYIDLYRWPKCD